MRIKNEIKLPRFTHAEWLKIYVGSNGAELVQIMGENIEAKQGLIDRLIVENMELKDVIKKALFSEEEGK